jgi:hypothetical protein
VLTTNPEQRVTAWQRMSFPGREVLHLAVLPSLSSRMDELWLVVRHTASGLIAVERLTASAPFVDAHVQLTMAEDGSATAPHLAGECALAYPLQAPEQACTVQLAEDGSFSLGAAAAGGSYCIGIPFRSELHTMPHESERSFNSIRQEGRVRLRLLGAAPSFYYRTATEPRWEWYDAARLTLPAPHNSSVRVPLLTVPRVGQGFALYVDGAVDFRLLSLSIEFDYHGK